MKILPCAEKSGFNGIKSFEKQKIFQEIHIPIFPLPENPYGPEHEVQKVYFIKLSQKFHHPVIILQQFSCKKKHTSIHRDRGNQLVKRKNIELQGGKTI